MTEAIEQIRSKMVYYEARLAEIDPNHPDWYKRKHQAIRAEYTRMLTCRGNLFWVLTLIDPKPSAEVE